MKLLNLTMNNSSQLTDWNYSSSDESLSLSLSLSVTEDCVYAGHGKRMKVDAVGKRLLH